MAEQQNEVQGLLEEVHSSTTTHRYLMEFIQSDGSPFFLHSYCTHSDDEDESQDEMATPIPIDL